MASTFRFWDVVTIGEIVTGKSITADNQATASNMALNLYWKEYDWRESIADFAPFWVSPGVQDYGVPFVVVPSDFLAMKRAYFWDLQAASNSLPYQTELSVVGDLSTTSDTDQPGSIRWRSATKSFRVHPNIPIGWGAPRYLIDGQYKRRPTVYLTDGTTINRMTGSHIMDALLPSDDMYMNVWIELMKWAFLNITGNDKSVAQFETARQALDEMARRENLDIKKPPVAPKNQLVGGFMSGWGYPLIR